MWLQSQTRPCMTYQWNCAHQHEVLRGFKVHTGSGAASKVWAQDPANLGAKLTCNHSEEDSCSPCPSDDAA